MKHKMYTWKEILKMKINKGKLMKKAGLPDKKVDFALPIKWVNEMVIKGINRDMLVSTTVMVHNEIVCVCSDVHYTLHECSKGGQNEF